jgi:hypothetical protein
MSTKRQLGDNALVITNPITGKGRLYRDIKNFSTTGNLISFLGTDTVTGMRRKIRTTHPIWFVESIKAI